MKIYPKISVVLPVYNGEKHIKEAVDSILKQSHNFFELLIINDGSTDKTFDIIDAVGLSGKEKRYPDEISGGEQQRAAIARAIVKEPKILLADEPTGNLDPNISMEILELLEMATDYGASVIMCTHNYPLIKYKKRKFLELNNGKIVE